MMTSILKCIHFTPKSHAHICTLSICNSLPLPLNFFKKYTHRFLRILKHKISFMKYLIINYYIDKAHFSLHIICKVVLCRTHPSIASMQCIYP